jgi:hypothetical protein
MKVYDQIKEMLCDELEDIARKNELTPNNLDIIDTSIDILKDIKTIEAMDQEYPDNNGYSQGYYRAMPYYMYDDMGMPRDGSSYARGRSSNAQRDSRGRYMSGGYSGDTKEELQRLLNAAKDDRERDAIRTALDHMNR